jgi:pimeloyl-ACP methyl ester carboxylesterase
VQPQDRYPNDHSYLKLDDGWCHYRVAGPEAGPTVLLIHGATVPGWEFDRLLPWLHDAGFRTLQVDLYGHGYSDRPRARHDHALFVRQIAALLDNIASSGTLHVMGHSLGAAVTAHLACHAAGRLGRIVLAAPMLDFVGDTRATRILHVPILGELVVHGYVLPMLVRRRRHRYTPIDDGRFAEMFRHQLKKPGFGRSLLKLVRDGALADQSAAYECLKSRGSNVLLLRGNEDVIISVDTITRIRRLLPEADFQEIAGTAHAFIIKDPDKVGPVVVDFLSR